MYSHVSRGLVLAALVGFLSFGSASPSLAATWVRIPGSPPVKVTQMSISKGRVLLKTEDGKMFSVPTDTPGLEIFLDGGDTGPGSGSLKTTAAPGVPGSLLTLQDILKMLREGTSEEVIAAFIEQSEARYVLSKGALADLRAAGASDTFVQFILRTGRGVLSTRGPLGRETEPGRAALAPEDAPLEPESEATAEEPLAPYPVSPTDYNAPSAGIPLDFYGGNYGTPGFSYPIGGYPGDPFGSDYCPPGERYGRRRGNYDGDHRGDSRREGRFRRYPGRGWNRGGASADVAVTNGALGATFSARGGSSSRSQAQQPGGRSAMRANAMPLGLARASSGASAGVTVPRAARAPGAPGSPMGPRSMPMVSSNPTAITMVPSSPMPLTVVPMQPAPSARPARGITVGRPAGPRPAAGARPIAVPAGRPAAAPATAPAGAAGATTTPGSAPRNSGGRGSARQR